MADVTIYKPANVTAEVIDGDPPEDQSALIEQLQEENAQLQAANDQLQANIDAAIVAAEKEKAADAAHTAGQGVLDALKPPAP